MFKCIVILLVNKVKLHGLTPMASPLAGFRNGAKSCTECHLFPLLRTGHSGTWVKNITALSLLMVFILLTNPADSFAVEKINIRTGKVSYLSFENQPLTIYLKESSQKNPEAIAREYLSDHGQQFGVVNQQEELKLIRSTGSLDSPKTIKLGTFSLTPTVTPVYSYSHVRFQQMYKNIPIFAGELITHLKNDKIFSVTAEISPDININIIPAITSVEAINIAKKDWQNRGLTANKVSIPSLYIFNPAMIAPSENQNYLIWYMEISDRDLMPSQKEYYFIDAHNGVIRFILPGILEARNRQIYDCKDTISSCSLARSENQAMTNIADVDNAHEYMGKTYDYFFSKYGRDSFNNAGATLNTYARVIIVNQTGQNICPNAQWTGSSIKICSGLALLDVLAHEFTHGVTQYEAGLVYSQQSGAINEGFSDIFASNTDGNWTIGEGSPLGIIRDMSNPPAKSHPDKLFSNYYCCGTAITDSCYGNNSKYVHSNSGVANKASYLISEGGTFNGCTITGLGRDKMGKIHYEALSNWLTSNTNFLAYYNGLNDACKKLYGEASFECQQVDNALKAVEINQQLSGSTESPKCNGQSPATPSCSTSVNPSPTSSISPTSGPSPTYGPSPTIPSGMPTNTPLPTQIQPTSFPTSSPQNADVSIWNSIIQNGQEVILANGTKLPKGTRISVCYNRLSGPITLTINRSGGLITKFKTVFSQAKKYGCLHFGSLRFLPLGELASQEGTSHIYTIESGGKTASTTLLVTKDVIPQPTSYLSPTIFLPTATITPQPTVGPSATPNPNITVTPTLQPSSTPSQMDIGALINNVSEDKIKNYLSNLVDNDNIPGADEKQTRYSPTSGNRTEADYIKRHFETYGIESEFQNFSIEGQNTQNIIGRIKGQSPGDIYILTAHMDSTASDANPNTIAPGADDNGSGTVVLMEVARILKNISPQLIKSLEFVAFSGEEQGLYGSYYYVRDKLGNKTVKGVVNLDMVGNRGSSDCEQFGFKEANREQFLADKIVDINKQYNIEITPIVGRTNIDASDHARFWEKNKPAIFGFECSFSPVYHTTNDKIKYINFNQLTKITKAIIGTLASLASQ
ncbi:M28 family peptidase [Candidatus Gottesmanbacteria bacterium]|nr:M28 family peptidase [Candidatus Gottesmanbacteria bacterium]